MSTSTQTGSTSTSTLSREQQQQLTEQLISLKQHQQIQQDYLFRQYQSQQVVLRQQQQRELHQHLERQKHQRMFDHPAYKQLEGKGKVDKDDQRVAEDSVKLKKEEDVGIPDSSRSTKGSSSAVSSEVKQRLQEFVLNKQQREAALASASASQDHFRQWYATSALSGPLDEDDFPLRKAASEPNLKLRSRLRQKVSSKRELISGSPLGFRRRDKNSGHSPVSKSFSGDPDRDSPTGHGSPPRDRDKSRHSEDDGREPYNGVHREFGRLPLFGSPSMPNITSGGSRSSLHFPSGSSLGFSSGSSPNLMSHIRPDHPYYLHYLWSEYLANHQLLSQALAFHGKDPKELPNMLAQRVPSETLEETSGASPLLQQARLKALIDAQYQILSQYQATVPLLYPSLYGTSPLSAYSKYYGGYGSSGSKGSSGSPSSSYFSKSHESLRQTKSAPGLTMSQIQQIQQRQAEEMLIQHQAAMQHAYYLHMQDLLKSRQKGPPSLQQKDQPARMVLKEHLLMQQKEKQAAASAAGYGPLPGHPSVSLKEHFKRLEKQNRDVEEEDEEAIEEDEEPAEIKPDIKPDISRTSLISDEREEHDTDRPFDRRQAEIADASMAGVSSAESGMYGSGHMSRIHSSPVYPPMFMKQPGDGEGTGLVYDTIMLKHQCSCGDTGSHPEHPGRLQSIWARLQETGVAGRCVRIRPRKATMAEIQTVHSEQHTMLYGGGTIGRKEGGIQSLKCFSQLPCGGLGVDADTIWNETHSSNAARMSAGCFIELAFKVATGELKNGFAIVRPPGHHAEAHQAMGFCYFNSVAIAARLLRMKVAVERLLIVDWDVHHGNGTQQMFYDDDHVLYLSIHRHDDGMFFPGTGKPEECGAGIGVGCNVNISLNGGIDPPYGDADYLSAFRTLVIPIAKEFNPDIILVSAGFDAAAGHTPQLGGYEVTAACFAYMTKQLMGVSNGRVALSLEGGYSLPSLCDAAEMCMRTLLGEKTPDLSEENIHGRPNANAVKSLERVAEIQGKYWPVVKRYASHIGKSMAEAQKIEKEEAETVNALASLSMQSVVKEPKRTLRIDEPMEES